MTISVIISTYNGAHKINVLLEALQKQTLSDFELLIIVDGSTDNTLEVLSAFEPLFPRMRIITQLNSGRSKVKNRGAKEASGDLLIFFDDDMAPLPDCIRKHHDFHETHESIILGGNPMEPVENIKTDIQNYKALLTQKWTAKYPQGISHLHSGNLFFTAANCSIPRDVFQRLKGFDERINDSEDFDFALRAIQLGIDVYFDKSNLAIHHDNITCRSYIKRLREYATAHHALADLHSSRKPWPRSDSFRVKRMIYRLFAEPAWVRLVDAGLFARILPRGIRYRLYSVIIQALAYEYPTTRIK